MTYQHQKDLVVVKVGTNVLANTIGKLDQLDERSFTRIGEQLRRMVSQQMGVILVSSGAITAGIIADSKKRSDISDLAEIQRYAARGWDTVIQRWKRAIGEEKVSSTLLTKREIHTAAMRSKALSVITCCLNHGDIFVVNENDTISDDEIKFGDNDTLAAAIAAECANAGLFRSVKLVLLTNVDGLYRDIDDSSTLIDYVNDIDLVDQYATGATSGHARGGMRTKLLAARTAKEAGVETYIANGRAKRAIYRSLNHEIGTCFLI